MSKERIVVVEEKGPGCFGKGAAILGMLISGFLLLNPTGGIIELIPDNFPIVGNLDEAALVGIFVSCLRYLGLDILPFGKRQRIESPEVIDVTPPKASK